MMWLAVIAAAFLASFGLTPIVRGVALRHGFLDLPNERSSHLRPTPRSGGYAIVSGMAIALLLASGWRDRWTFATGLAMGVMLTMAAVDEFRPLPRWSRLVVQIGVGVALAVGVPLPVPGVPSWFGLGIAVVCIVWCVNAYNFMDGLNGISSVTAIVCGAAFGWMAFAKGDVPAAYVALAAAAAAAGFLPFNLPSGSIFMGDTGSANLGLVFGSLVLRLSVDGISPVACLLPLTPFFLDAGTTILRRMLRGERFFSTPHRSHFYQRLQQQGWAHAAVTALYGAMAAVGAAVALAFPNLSISAAIAAVVAFVAAHAIVFARIEIGWRRSQSGVRA